MEKHDVKAGLSHAPQRQQKDLAEPNEVFRLLVDAVEDYAIFALDTKGVILTWNLGAQRLKGYLPHEVIGRHFSVFYPKEDIDRRHPEFELKEATEKGKYEEEGWRVRKDGKLFWANVVITALKNEAGVLLGFGKVTRDLTAKKNAEAKLRESEERFRLMVEGISDYAIFMLDPKGNVATWNKGAERNKGYSESEILGEHFSKFYPQEDLDVGKPGFELREAIKSGRFADEGWRIKKDGSRFWANVIITPVYDKNNTLLGFSKITRDLTERKKAEDALRNANAQLEVRVAERTTELSAAMHRAEEAVKARDQFFSIASHELKTPLTSLKLQAQMRKRHLAKGDYSDFAPAKLPKLCEDDEKQVNRLAFLVDNMLDISRLTSDNFRLTFSEINLAEFFEELVRRLGPSLKETGTEVFVHSAANLHGVWDRHRLEQVFTNLLSNAAKYASGKPVDITFSTEDKTATISVRDHGEGIPAAAQLRIFEPFERVNAKSDIVGLGLGLYIVKQIVDAHGGSITVKSAPGEGAEFIVILPIDAARSASNN
ncbi:MAG: PAS domain S-box protein [Bacteriovoracia bacterium]